MPLFLRWIAVLPGAILAGLAATFPLHWILVSVRGLCESRESVSRRNGLKSGNRV
jgi:hypothetical protein